MNRGDLIRFALAASLAVACAPGSAQKTLEIIDPARRLQISVRFDDSLEASRRSLGASGRIGSGGSSLEIRARESTTSAQARVDQRVQVLEGSRATIYTGQSQPVRERRFIRTPAGVVSQEVTVIQELATGFEIVPRLSGAAVEVEVLSSRQTGTGSEARIATRASGRLGEWFALGSVETRRVWILVELLP